MLGQKQVERVGDVGLQVFARDDGIEKAVLQQELGGLKTLRQLLANGLLDDARAGETDQRAGLGDVQITQHGVAGGHAAGGDRKSTRLNSSHLVISYAVFCLKKKKK